MKFFFVVALLFLNVPLLHGSLTVTPSNQVAVVGSSVVFDCSTSYYYYPSWKFYSLYNNGISCTLVQGSTSGFSMGSCPGIDRYTAVSKHNLNVALMINVTEMSDAGTYVCVDTYDGQSTGALYGILDPYMFISSNTSNTVPQGTWIMLTCLVYYNGSDSMPPLIEWTDGQGQTILSNTTSTSTRIQSTIVVRATLTTSFPFQCSVSFLAPTFLTVPGISQASNAPNFNMSASYNVTVAVGVYLLANSTTVLHVVWSLPYSNATHYLVQSSSLSIYEYVSVTQTVYPIKNLIAGTTYTVLVSACNDINNQFQCYETIKLTNNTFPASPQDVYVTSRSSSSMTVSWTQSGHVDTFVMFADFLRLSNVTISCFNCSSVTARVYADLSFKPHTLTVITISGNLTCLPTTIDLQSDRKTITIIVLSVFVAVFFIAAVALFAVVLWTKCYRRKNKSGSDVDNRTSDNYNARPHNHQNQSATSHRAPDIPMDDTCEDLQTSGVYSNVK
jgi:hypothetical protein